MGWDGKEMDEMDYGLKEVNEMDYGQKEVNVRRQK